MTKTSRFTEFFAAYDRWQAECLVEYNKRYGECRILLPDGDAYEPGEVVEFSEDGNAYPHGQGGTNWIPRAVTPWEQSPHFIGV